MDERRVHATAPSVRLDPFGQVRHDPAAYLTQSEPRDFLLSLPPEKNRERDLTSRGSFGLFNRGGSEIPVPLDVRLLITADGRGHEALLRHSARGGSFLLPVV